MELHVAIKIIDNKHIYNKLVNKDTYQCFYM